MVKNKISKKKKIFDFFIQYYPALSQDDYLNHLRKGFPEESPPHDSEKLKTTM
jgi:hypothetical protein